MPNFKLGLKLGSIGAGLQRNASNFLIGCHDAALEQYASFRARQANNTDDDQTESNVPSLEAPAAEPTNIEAVAEPTPAKHKMTGDEFCAMLNRRIEALREQEGFEELERYTNDTQFYPGECFTMRIAKIQHNRRQALRYVTRMEFFAKMYKAYRQDFAALKSQAEEIECLLSTDNAFYAEVEIPKDEAFTSNEAATNILHFSYSSQGVAAAKRWIKTTKDSYYNSKKPAIAKR